MKQDTYHHRGKWIAAFVGSLLGFGAPLGWLFLRAVTAQPEWLRNEWSRSAPVYLYMTAGTVTVFAFFGFFLGRRGDAASNEADTVKMELGEVTELAFTDVLTGLHNARHIHDQLSSQIDSARRYRFPLACLMLDIDDFKKINDTLGHPFGDIVLAALGRILSGSVRTVDIAGRLGGEEFMILMPHTSGEHALPIAERIRSAVEKTAFSLDGANASVTVSIGVACFPSIDVADKSGLLKAADDALYKAKRAGKNQTFLHRGPPDKGAQQ